jgi:hypothetical protein
MPTKPSDNVPEFASNANFSVGQTGIIGTPTRETIGLSAAVANGAVPWLAESPLTGQHFNEWMHRGWGLLDWVYQGTSGPAADAHIVETDADGRAFLVAAADATDATLHVEVTGTGGQAIIAEAGNSHAIVGENNSDTDAAIVARNLSALSGAIGLRTQATGYGVGAFAVTSGAGGTPIGFQASPISTVSASARGFSCDVGASASTGAWLDAGTNGGTGLFVIASPGCGEGIHAVGPSGSNRPAVLVEHNGSGIGVSIQTSDAAAAIVVDGSSSSASSGTAQFTGNGGASHAVFAYSFVNAANDSEQNARSVIYAEAGEGTGGRGTAITGFCQDPFSVSGIGVVGASNGLGAQSAGVFATSANGQGYGIIATGNATRSAVRISPRDTVLPITSQFGDLSVLNASDPLNDGLNLHDGTAWRRIAHTAYRYREPAVGFSNPSSYTGPGAVSLLAPATFTAADGGKVLICVDMGLSHSSTGPVGITVASDNGAGGSVTTHFSSRDVRFATTTNASTETSRQWSWRRKITPTNTGPRRYYVEIDVPGATTVYYWDVGLSVHGELTP